MLNDSLLGTSAKELHLGIQRNQKNQQRYHCIKHKIGTKSSIHTRGGRHAWHHWACPEEALLQYTTYVLPTLLYAPEALNIKDMEVDLLSSYHRKNIHCILPVPSSTAIPALHLLSGVPKIEALLHIRVLTLFCNILAAKPNIPLAMYIKENRPKMTCHEGPKLNKLDCCEETAHKVPGTPVPGTYEKHAKEGRVDKNHQNICWRNML